MTEPDVAITDYLVAVESALFAALIWRSGAPASGLGPPFAIFFAATATAAVAAGTVHGFFSESQSGARTLLWRATLLALGIAAYATWVIGARLFLPETAARAVQIGAAVVVIGYAGVVTCIDDRYWIAIVHYLPPALFLLIGLTATALGEPRPSTLWGIAGMALTFVAAVVQQRRMALHRAYFTHNALYHTIQALALFLIFRAARGLI